MLHIVLILFCGLLPLIGAAAILWFLIHLWVAFRMDAKLTARDYSYLGAGIFAIIIGSTHAAGSSMPYMNTPALRDCRQGHTVPRTAKLGRGWG